MTTRLASLLAAATLGLAAASPSHAEAARPAAQASADSKVIIPVEGLTCASCSLTVRRALKKLSGVKKIEAGPQENEAAVTYDAAKVQPAQLVEAINQLGFKAGTPVKG